MNFTRKRLLAGLLAFAACTAAHAADSTVQGSRLAGHYRLAKPDGRGPFPAVLLVAGCSGFEAGFSKPHYDGVQARLVALGFLTVRVDTLAARAVPSCAMVSAESAADDIAWTAEQLKTDPLVKAGAINVLGWSWGGAGALLALRRHGTRPAARVDAVVVYYPACRYVQPWEADVSVLVLHGAIDNVATLKECTALFARLPSSKRPKLVVLEQAHHGFDIAQLPKETRYGFGTLGSNPRAAALAWDELTAFLRR